MNELSERARLLVSKLARGILDAENTVEYCDLDSALGLSFAMPLIEQALLAERKSVWEEAAKIAKQFLDDEWVLTFKLSVTMIPNKCAAKLRAAAEKELDAVATPRGGE